MLKNKIMHGNKEKKILPLSKYQSVFSVTCKYVNMRKCYLPYGVPLKCFLDLTWKCSRKKCIRDFLLVVFSSF